MFDYADNDEVLVVALVVRCLFCEPVMLGARAPEMRGFRGVLGHARWNMF